MNELIDVKTKMKINDYVMILRYILSTSSLGAPG